MLTLYFYHKMSTLLFLFKFYFQCDLANCNIRLDVCWTVHHCDN